MDLSAVKSADVDVESLVGLGEVRMLSIMN